MDLSKQVVSLELSKKLKELGVKQESLFWWTDVRGRQPDFDYGDRVIHGQSPHPLDKILCSAFTVSELGEMLPEHIHLDGKELPQFLFIAHGTKGGGLWVVGYSDYQTEGTPIFTDENEANCRAKLLIYLIEQGSVKAG